MEKTQRIFADKNGDHVITRGKKRLKSRFRSINHFISKAIRGFVNTLARDYNFQQLQRTFLSQYSQQTGNEIPACTRCGKSSFKAINGYNHSPKGRRQQKWSKMEFSPTRAVSPARQFPDHCFLAGQRQSQLQHVRLHLAD